MNEKQRGVTLVEVIVASGITAIIALSFSTILYFLFKANTQFQREQEMRIDADLGMKAIVMDISNTAVLEPEENYLDLGDHMYRGFYGVNLPLKDVDLSVCQSGKDFSILRYSTILSKLRPSKLLRPWNELQVLDPTKVKLKKKTKMIPTDLRLSYEVGENHLFQLDPTTPKIMPELLIIDVDGLISRKYRVDSAEHYSGNNDPYDDKPNPKVTFTYTKVHVKMPLMLNNSPNEELDQWFISESPVYAVESKILCVTKDGKLANVNELTKAVTVLLDPDFNKQKITRFHLSYYGTKPSEKLLPSLFHDFPLPGDAVKRNCLNTIQMKLDLEPLAEDNAIKIHMSRTFFLRTANSRRPVSCN